MSEDNGLGEAPQRNGGGESSDDLQNAFQTERSATTASEDVSSVENSSLLQTSSSDLQRRRVEAVERTLIDAESNLSRRQSQSPELGRRIRFGGAIGLQGRSLFNRNFLVRDDVERAILIPIRTTSSMSGSNLPMSSSRREASATLRNLLGSTVDQRGDGSNSNGPRINVSTFFMELTYSTDSDAHQPFHHLFKNSTETQRRRMEVHAANTVSIIQQYCPSKLSKLNQFRCCLKTQREDIFDFTKIDVKPLDLLSNTQVKCRTKVIVIAQESCGSKWGNPCTSYLLSYLSKKHIYATCITFLSDLILSTLIETLSSLSVFPEKVRVSEQASGFQAKTFLVMSTIAKLLTAWNMSILIIDSSPSKIIDIESVREFAARFQIKVFDLQPETGTSKHFKVVAKRVGIQIRKVLLRCSLEKVKHFIGRGDFSKTTRNEQDNTVPDAKLSCLSGIVAPNDECRRIVLKFREHLSLLVPNTCETGIKEMAKISVLENGIMTDIRNSVAFKDSSKTIPGRKAVASARISYSAAPSNRETSRPVTAYSQHSDEDCRLGPAHFPVLIRETDKVSDLLFNELNQRWRCNGPQRFIPSTPDAGPYCEKLLDSEKQQLLSVLQEVTNFELLKDIRNELKDSKKDLEGRLYGYNPDFSNLIASAEEYLHGKASGLEPDNEELDFYKLPVSFVLSDAEVKYMKAKPPLYVVAGESPAQIIKAAIEESTKLFLDAVIHQACGSRRIPASRRSQTKAIVVVEDNNEVLELLTIALWFYEKTPLATFQAKYCTNSEKFLLSLDACRFYFGTYPAFTAKKDERVFERWLGVGMNGILRGHQHKILLIDFPRPGMPLEQSKSILMTRLKAEEQLHGIKSFTVGRPTKKEDNLSTVEHVLDEIQKCLSPRDKLLFRKARRMYMDLKLYKQIEQKSRQDIKALRDWGLPEPDDDHILWEALRRAELVVNSDSCVDLEKDTSALGSRATSSCSGEADASKEPVSDGSDDESDQTFRSDEDDGESLVKTVTTSQIIEKTKRVTSLQESLDSTTGSPCCQDDFVISGDHSLRSQDKGKVVPVSGDINLQSADRECSSGEDLPEFVNRTCSQAMASLSNFDSLSSTTEIDMKVFHTTLKVDGSEDSDSQRSLLSTDNGESDHNKNSKALKRSPAFANLLDENIYSSNNTQRVGVDQEDGGESSSGYTKIEFTLAPKLSSGNSSLTSHNSIKEDPDKLSHSSEVQEARSCKTINCKPLDPCKNRSLHQACTAHLGKLGKSLTRFIKKRRVIPEPKSLKSAETSHRSTRRDDVENTVNKMAPQRLQIISLDSSAEENREKSGRCKSETEIPKGRTSGWFRNALKYFRRTSKPSTEGK